MIINKNKVLSDLAALIDLHRVDIIAENAKDLSLAKGIDPTLIDRLKVDQKKVDIMISSIHDVIKIEDPVGKLLSEYDHPNGIKVRNKIVPFGKILIIYESRPDVTIEAAISAFKAGNKIYLKGGKEARNSNLYLVKLWHQALEQNDVSTEFIHYLDISREETQTLIAENPYKLDLIIPRGGEGLINYIRANTSIPLVVSGRGNNFAYVHSDADFKMAKDIILNGKSRLSVCNALDKVLFNEQIPALESKLKDLIDMLDDAGISIYAAKSLQHLDIRLQPVDSDEIYYEEFLSAKIMFDTVPNVGSAIDAINKYSGGHSASIICYDEAIAAKFQNEVDAAAVYHNASTRFTDGGQFGFGAEIAISTQKLHFRGPLGLSQLVTNKWFVSGQGQIRV